MPSACRQAELRTLTFHAWAGLLLHESDFDIQSSMNPVYLKTLGRRPEHLSAAPRASVLISVLNVKKW
jgi:hypothetical protein